MEANTLDEYEIVATGDEAKKPEDQTVFSVTTLTFEQDTFIENQISEGVGEGTILANVLNMGLKGVKNLKGDGGTVELERQEVKEGELLPGKVAPWKNESISRIPILQRSILSKQIRFGNQLTGKEVKN